jgi:8-amino-7-oxononanoate synthase
MDWIKSSLRELKEKGLFRERIKRDGLIDFCGNDYLGLKNHPEVIAEAKRAIEDYGLGSGASQLVSGYTEEHERLERALSELKGSEACVLFGSGYLANTGAIPVLAGEGDLILSDELNHASLIDGARLSRARVLVYRHRDTEHLRDLLKRHRANYRKLLIVTDSLFSMDGDIAPLPELFEVAEEFEGMLYIDDAHATGTLGEGRGSLHHFNLRMKENVILMGTLSKALGSYGAFLCGCREVIELIINRARSLIFTTSLPPSVCAGARKAVEIIISDPSLSRKLKGKTRKIYEKLKELPYEVIFHGTPIIPIMIGDERRALALSERLLERGILLRAIRYPTVPKGKARLRLTVSLNYKSEDIKKLIDELENLAYAKV